MSSFASSFFFRVLDGDLRDAIDDGSIADGLVARDFERTDGGGLFDAAELVVVDQLGDGRMRAADRAVGILAQLQRAEVHAQRVDQQQAADQRLADAEDQLDDLGRLDDADEAGQNAEHATLRAGGNEPGRRRLRVEAAIARAFLGGEDAGLSFEAEDGAVGVGLADQDAGVVDEVARLEVVGAVGDDVVVLEDLERVRRWSASCCA